VGLGRAASAASGATAPNGVAVVAGDDVPAVPRGAVLAVAEVVVAAVAVAGLEHAGAEDGGDGAGEGGADEGDKGDDGELHFECGWVGFSGGESWEFVSLLRVVIGGMSVAYLVDVVERVLEEMIDG